MQLKPKSLWQSDEQARKELERIVGSITFQQAASAALAYYATTLRFTAHADSRLCGAFDILDILMNLHDVKDDHPQRNPFGLPHPESPTKES